MAADERKAQQPSGSKLSDGIRHGSMVMSHNTIVHAVR